MANSVDPDQTAPIGAVCTGSTLFAFILNSAVILGNYLQQTTSADDIFRRIFFLALKGLIFSVIFHLQRMTFEKNDLSSINRMLDSTHEVANLI